MGALQRLEQRLEQAISGVFARAFRSAVQPVEISAALAREVDNSAQVLSRDRRLVPNEFHVELAPADHERLHAMGPALQSELVTQLEQHAHTQAYVFTGPIQVHLDSGHDLTTGRFRVRSEAVAGVSNTGPAPSEVQRRHAAALLEVNGEHVPLHPPGIVIGRGSDVDLKVTDPGVSRRHLEIRVVETPEGVSATAHDLGSTNGLVVNNKRVESVHLADGTTMRIGNTTLVYRRINPPGQG